MTEPGASHELVRDRYQPLVTLGAGGEARVMKALDHQHDRVVALKIRTVRSAHARDELLREARVLFGLPPHPALPLVREDFFDGNDYVVAMDWVDGTDLDRMLYERGNPGLAPSSVLAYLAEAAEALTFLHANDVVHGDVKPANLILTSGGRIKLVDFGMSSSLGLEGSRTGTVGYRAPELFAGEAPSRATDVYALAATAFTLLTGKPPAGVLPSWDGIDPDRASHLEEVLRAGLATNPEQRPGTPGELIERLRAGWGASLPTGVVTFCMSDIEGSTSLWERDPEAMAAALVRHDELVAQMVEEHGGRFLKSKGEGDSTVSVFESAPAALEAALAVNHALDAEAWPSGLRISVRLGLHTGEAEARAGDYFGPTVNRAARIRAQADGGEVFLSDTTARVVRDSLPDGYSLVDLGLYRLKGVPEPERVRALSGPGVNAPLPATDCPYRGLLSFQETDQAFFFGREDVVCELLERIASRELLAVVGASGSGKSSLLRAGLVAAVHAGEVAGAHRATVLSPGAEPPGTLDGNAAELLVVDQFEELFTLCDDASVRERFVAALLSHPGPVAISVRADFYGELSAYPDLARAVAANQVLLGPMTEEQLRRAILEPARLAGLRFEPGLVDLILRDVVGEPGALPLLSHALRSTWERRDGRTLTVEAYQAGGGVASAVAQTADEVAAQLDPGEGHALLRSIFLRLTELGEGVEDTRRRVPIAELVPHGTPRAEVQTLLDLLADARLLTLGEETAEVAHEVLIREWPLLRRWLDEDRVSVRIHRALGDAARLWDAAGRTQSDLYRGARLSAATEWTHEHPGLLNATERAFLDASVAEEDLRRLADQRSRRRLRRSLTVSAGLLVVASTLLVIALISRHAAGHAEATARSKALASEAQSQVGFDPQRALLLARFALAAAPTPEANLAATEALDADTARAVVPSIDDRHCERAGLIVYDAGRRAVGRSCGDVYFVDLVRRRLLRRVHLGAEPGFLRLAPSGRTLIAVSGNSMFRIGLVSMRARRIFTAPFEMRNVAISPNGREFAVSNFDAVLIVDPARHRWHVVGRGDATANRVFETAWASPHQLLVVANGATPGTGNLGGGLTEIDLRSRTRTFVRITTPPHFANATRVAVSPDHRTWFVTGNDFNTRTGKQVPATWALDARTRRVLWRARGPAETFTNAVASSANGRLLAVGYGQGTVDVFDASTGRLVIRELGADSVVAAVGFDVNGRSVLSFSEDGVIRIWAAHGSEQLRVQLPDDPAVGFDSTASTIFAVGDRGEAIDRRTGKVLRTFPGFPAAAAFSGDCPRACFATSGDMRWLVYRDARSSRVRIREVAARTGRTAGVFAVPRLDSPGVLSNGQIIDAYVDGTVLRVRIIDRRTGRSRALQPGPAGDGNYAVTPAATPDGRLIAVGDNGYRIDVWNARSGRLIRSTLLPEAAASGASAVPAPNGRFVLVNVLGGAYVRIDLGTGRSEELPGQGVEGTALAISPDSRYYAIGHADGTINLYNAQTLRVVRVHKLNSSVLNVVFSPNSRELAAEDTNHVLEVWDTCAICENPHALARAASKASIRTLTTGERATFGVTK